MYLRPNNMIALTGYIDNIKAKGMDSYTSLFFTLSNYRLRKDKNGEQIKEYDTFPCFIYGSNSGNNQTDSYGFKIDNFLDKIIAGQRIKIYGEVQTQNYALIGNELVKVGKHTDKTNITQYIRGFTITVNGYELMETKESAENRIESRNDHFGSNGESDLSVPIAASRSVIGDLQYEDSDLPVPTYQDFVDGQEIETDYTELP